EMGRKDALQHGFQLLALLLQNESKYQSMNTTRDQTFKCNAYLCNQSRAHSNDILVDERVDLLRDQGSEVVVREALGQSQSPRQMRRPATGLSAQNLPAQASKLAISNVYSQ